MRDVINKVCNGIDDGIFNDLQRLIDNFGLAQKWRLPQTTNDYEWISYDWIASVIELNVLIENNDLTRTEIVIYRDDDARHVDVKAFQWKHELKLVFGDPAFSGDWETEGFPEDEDFCRSLTLWNPSESCQVRLLLKSYDADTPEELALALIPTHSI